MIPAVREEENRLTVNQWEHCEKHEDVEQQ